MNTKQSPYINSQPRWTLTLSAFGFFTEATVDAYLAHHKGFATDLNKDRHSVLSIRSNLSLFLNRDQASESLDRLCRVLTARGTHRVVLIGKVKYLEPVGLDKPFSQVGLHSFSQGSNFFQPVIV